MAISMSDIDSITKLEGGTDGKLIGNTGDKLNVSSTLITNNTGLILNSKIRLIYNFTDQSFTGSSYSILYSYTGTGFFHNMLINADSDKLLVKLVIDNQIIFTDLNSKELNANGFTTATNSTLDCWVSTHTTSSLSYSPSLPILFDSNVIIYVKKSDNNAFKIQGLVVNITKET